MAFVPVPEYAKRAWPYIPTERVLTMHGYGGTNEKYTLIFPLLLSSSKERKTTFPLNFQRQFYVVTSKNNSYRAIKLLASVDISN